MLVILVAFSGLVGNGGGRLYLSGVDPALAEQIELSGLFDLEVPTRTYAAEPVVGRSTARAVADAEVWRVTRSRAEERKPVAV